MLPGKNILRGINRLERKKVYCSIFKVGESIQNRENQTI